jgi:starch synthase
VEPDERAASRVPITDVPVGGTVTAMHVLFAAAECSPLVRVGGLAEAASGLVRTLRASGLEATMVIPDYWGRDEPLALAEAVEVPLAVADWAGPATARFGIADGFGPVVVVDVPGSVKPHPYVDPTTGMGWPDNPLRFFAFSAAVGALAELLNPDVVHVNDWHTAAVLGLATTPRPSVLTIHNLAYQGQCELAWAARLATAPDTYVWGGDTNPLVGGVRLADRVVAVSPTYAREILDPVHGMGLHEILAAKGPALTGIINGIDVATWDPSTNAALPARFDADHLARRARCRAHLLGELGWSDALSAVAPDLIIGMVTRLVDQKGVDLALTLVPFLEDLGARLVILGSGEPGLTAAARQAMHDHPRRVSFHEGYDDGLGHRIFAGCDVVLVPSRFEPCGLTQMQAMRYGAMPIVTDVGGLHDTVVDADRDRLHGTGFVARHVDPVALLDAVHRAARAWRNRPRREAIQRRGMTHDWSWAGPAEQFVDLYDELLRSYRPPSPPVG